MMALYRLVYVLLKTLLIVLSPFMGEKIKRWVTLRSWVQRKTGDLNLQNTIWVHASSGEIEYAKALIRELKEKSPQTPLVVTYSSESAEKLFDNIRQHVDVFLPLPWDDRYSINSLIKKINPQVLILARTDLWPEMIFQCARRKIPMAVISYFPKMNFFSKLLLKPLLRKLSFISCVDAPIQSWVTNLIEPQKTTVTADGDTRFDQVFIRTQQPSKVQIQSQSKIFTFGSTWPEDEDKIKPLIQQVLTHQQKVILSPHDISTSRLEELFQWLTKNKIDYRKLSELNETILFDFQVLVIDRIGFLADIYRYSDFAFVGGSFKSRVHSVMEPLACGLPVLVGPYMQNSPEALRYSRQNPQFVFECRNSSELLAEYQKLNSTESQKSTIIAEIQKNQGASKKIADFIRSNFLKKVDF